MSHRAILQRNHVYLKERLEVEPILDRLYAEGIFTLVNKDACMAKHGRAAQSDELLAILTRKDRKGYDAFLQILEDVQPYIKDELEGHGDQSTACAPDKQLMERLKRLEMENDKLRRETLQREKSHVQLKKNHQELRNRLLKEEDATGSDRERVPGSRLGRGIFHDPAFHLMTFRGQSITLQCPKLQLDAARANTDWCHVTTDGELVNSRPATRHSDSGRLQTYIGTCSSTPIPLPPPPSNVTPAAHTPRYWETHSRIGVMVGERWRLVLEIGVGEESQVDSELCVREQHRSWCVCVGRCGTHQGSLCTRVCQQGIRGECYRNTISATPGTQVILHYGVVLDVGRGRLGFIDLDREIVLAKLDVKWRESLVPMFSVGGLGDFTVNMKVVSGVDITLTDSKKSLIYNALT